MKKKELGTYEDPEIVADPLGSYTGVAGQHEEPVQDADDL